MKSAEELDKDTLEDIIEWDVENWSLALPFWSKYLPSNEQELDALELGAGTGGLSLWLALKGHKVVCSDVEEASGSDPGPLHEKYKVRHRIERKDLNALDLPYDKDFDLVVFKSIMGAASRGGASENKRKLIEGAYKALKPGGRLFFAENLAASPLHRILRKKFVRWGADWNYLRYEELPELLAPFTSYALKAKGFFGVLGRTEAQRRALGKVDRTFEWMLPPSWRYVVFVIAKK